MADGQVTMGGTVVKPNVRKTRKIGEHVIGGFAGATADALTLFERLETKLEEHSGQLTRCGGVFRAPCWGQCSPRMACFGLVGATAGLVLGGRSGWG